MRKSLFLILALVVFALGAGMAFAKLRMVHPALTKSLSQPMATMSPAKPSHELLMKLTPAVGTSNWSDPSPSDVTTTQGTVQGFERTTTVTGQISDFQSFEDKNLVTSLGFSVDNDLAADGPGSSQWGYSRMVNGEKQILVYSYAAQGNSSNPNQPIQFNCPCQITLTVFVSDLNAYAQAAAASPSPSATSGAIGMANPASLNCTKQGGTLQIQTRGDGGQYGLCQFEDDMACEEWALLRGDCPVGGVKTTGYDNVQQMYCAWVGGRTVADPNAQCTLPDRSVCSVNDLYNGKCGS